MLVVTFPNVKEDDFKKSGFTSVSCMFTKHEPRHKTNGNIFT